MASILVKFSASYLWDSTLGRMVVLAKNASDYSGKLSGREPDTGSRTRLEVPASLAGLRLDQALARLLPQYSRSRLQDWIRRQRVKLNGVGADPKDRVWGGEHIEVCSEADPAALADQPQEIPLSIVHEDDDLLAIDKPAGLVVHPGSGNPQGTLLNALLHHAPALTDLPRAGIVHRLDKDTSGLLVVAKTLEAQTALVRQLQARTVSRVYHAFVTGVPRAAGTVEAPIGRHPVARTKMAVVARGKPAITHYRVLASGNAWSLVECKLETGRTHQIRVHMHSIGHPLIGDPVYFHRPALNQLPEAARAFPRQALHAHRLELEHPRSAARLRFDSPLPVDMIALKADLERDAPAR